MQHPRPFERLLLLCFFLAAVSGTKDGRRVAVKEVVLDSPVSSIEWVSSNLKSVLCLTTRGRLYRSTNGGDEWMDITDQLHAPSKNDVDIAVKVDRIHVSPADVSTILAVGNSKYHFISQDSGATWTRIKSKHQIHTWVFHPTKPHWGLLSFWTSACNAKTDADSNSFVDEDQDCVHLLYLTRDAGKTFEPIKSYVVQFGFGEKANQQENRIYFSHFKQRSGSQSKLTVWSDKVDLSYMDLPDAGQPISKKYFKLVPSGNKFLISSGYIFVAKLKDVYAQTVTLLVSSDGGAYFEPIELPVALEERSYTLLDLSEGAVMLHVYHGHHGSTTVGNVYVSDEKGVRYSLSLPDNVRNSNGDCEFDRVQGLEGIFMGNFLDNDDELHPDKQRNIEDSTDDVEAVNFGSLRGKHTGKSEDLVRTVISWNKGGSWHYLKAPQVDSKGKPFNCENSKCWLHLHGVTEYQNFAPFYSVENAVGVIMGTGNVGSHLRYENDEINTYISRDAGLTWLEAHQGAYIYEFGDHGGLVVMADDLKKTKQVIFSWNEGQSWYDFDIGDQAIDIDNIVTEPNSTSTKFLLYGSRGGSGIMYHLNFETLQQPACQGHFAPNAVSSDYETWSPQSGGSTTKCLNGRQITYTRRKPTSECFNGQDFKRPTVSQNCQCSMEDFECEIGFVRDVSVETASAACHPALEGGIRFPEMCIPNQLVWVDAYRKVPGNKCEGGWSPAKVQLPCPANGHLTHGALGVLLLIFLIAVSLATVTYLSKQERFQEWFKSRGIDFSNTTKYINLNTPGFDGPANAEDEVGNRMDHDMENMANIEAFMHCEDDYEDAPRLLTYTNTDSAVDAPAPAPRGSVDRAAAVVPRLEAPTGGTKAMDFDAELDLL